MSHKRPDETEEDLDRTIAEQMACLPAWWLKAEQVQSEKSRARTPERMMLRRVSRKPRKQKSDY